MHVLINLHSGGFCHLYMLCYMIFKLQLENFDFANSYLVSV